jgi:hypothetical protein
VGAARKVVQRKVELVPVGADQRDATLEVPPPGVGQSVQEPARPGAPVVHAHDRLTPGQAAVVGFRGRLQLVDQGLACLHERRARLVEPCVPHIEGGGHLRTEVPPVPPQQGTSLAEDPLHLLDTAGGLRIDDGQCLVQEVPAVAGARAHHPDVLRREHRGADGLVEIAPTAHVLPVHHGP